VAQLLKEIAPSISAAAVIVGDAGWSAGYIRSIEDAARALSISVTVIEIHNQSEIEQKIPHCDTPREDAKRAVWRRTLVDAALKLRMAPRESPATSVCRRLAADLNVVRQD
jgi:hypothetical protein